MRRRPFAIASTTNPATITQFIFDSDTVWSYIVGSFESIIHYNVQCFQITPLNNRRVLAHRLPRLPLRNS